MGHGVLKAESGFIITHHLVVLFTHLDKSSGHADAGQVDGAETPLVNDKAADCEEKIDSKYLKAKPARTKAAAFDDILSIQTTNLDQQLLTRPSS